MNSDPDELLLDAAVAVVDSEYGRLVDALKVLIDLAIAVSDDKSEKRLLLMLGHAKRLCFDLHTLGGTR